jgi:hypothetical protein
VPSPPPPTDAADRALGRRLAERIERLGTTSPQRIRELLPDLLRQDPTLQAPLHDLVARATFGRMVAAAGHQPRSGLREELVQELAETYSQGMTTRLASVLAGLLEPRTVATAAGTARSAKAPSARRPPPPSREEAAPRPGGLWGLAALTAAVALGSGLVFGLVRSNRLCTPLGLCLPSEADAAAAASIETGLNRAERAAARVAGASDLEDFAAGLEQLDSSLLNLVSRRLNPRQDKQRQRLQERADAAHRRLREEQRAQRSLEEAEALIGGLERSSAVGPERLDALAEVRARLDAVAGDSFARSAVGALELRLGAIRERPPAPENAPPNPEPPAAPAAPSARRPEGGPTLPAPPPPLLPPPPLPPPPLPAPTLPAPVAAPVAAPPVPPPPP